jgi:hypothetical protein
MTLEELVDEVRTQVTAHANLNTFVFDDISAINENAAQTYPMLLMRPNSDTIDLRTNTATRTIDFYIADLYYQDDVDSLEAQYSDMEGWGFSLINTLYNNEDISYSTDKTITSEKGREQYNDSLIVVRLTFSLDVFNCWTS